MIVTLGPQYNTGEKSTVRYAVAVVVVVVSHIQRIGCQPEKKTILHGGQMKPFLESWSTSEAESSTIMPCGVR